VTGIPSTLKFFSIGNSYYMIRATAIASDPIYKWSSDTNFFGVTPVQNISHSLTYDNIYHYDFIQVPGITGSRQFLIGAGESSALFEFIGGQFQVSQMPFSSGSNQGLRCFQIGTNNFVAIGKLQTSGGGTDIFKWNGTNWSLYQSLHGAGFLTVTAIQDFTVNNVTYLVAAENDIYGSTLPASKVFKWNGVQFNPAPIQTFSFYGVTDIEIFTIDTFTYMIVSILDTVNFGIPSQVYRWNNNVNVFDPISTIFGDLEDGISTVNTISISGQLYAFAGYVTSMARLSSVFQLI